MGSTDRFQLTIGPEFRHMKTHDDDPTKLTIEAPYGSGSFSSLRLKGTIAADTRQLTTANVLDMASGTGSRQPADQPPGSGIRFLGSAYVAPRSSTSKRFTEAWKVRLPRTSAPATSSLPSALVADAYSGTSFPISMPPISEVPQIEDIGTTASEDTPRCTATLNCGCT